MGVGLQEGPTKPAQLTQTTPSSAFIKENMDVLRTMIKDMTCNPKQRRLQGSLYMKNSKKKILAAPEQKTYQNDSLKSPQTQRLESQSKSKAKPRGEKARSRGKRSGRGEYNEKAKILRNVKVNESSKDQEDHQGFFSAAAEQENGPCQFEVPRRILTIKRYAKDPMEIHGIMRRMNKGLQEFMDRFKPESSHIKGVSPVLRISTFMH
nr:reverse transcriptase domain-containing protein [Tanacetum cinerariifolium]